MPQLEGKLDGTQAIRRASTILKYISLNPSSGATLNQVCESTELSRSTAHRILKCLVQERLVNQSDDAKRYTIGTLVYELGLAVRAWQEDVLNWRPVLESVSTDTGVTAYLMGRSGNESICLDKVEGPSIVRVIPVEVGQRRPLGVGAGAAALLASIPDEECEQVIQSIGPHLARYSVLKSSTVSEIVRKAKATGFAESHSYVAQGVYGLGIAIRNGKAPARLALSLAAHESIAKRDAIQAWKECLLKAVKQVKGG